MRAISAGLRGAKTLSTSAATSSFSGSGFQTSAPTAAARSCERAARRKAAGEESIAMPALRGSASSVRDR